MDMPVELILRAENKADTIKTEQQYIELQVTRNFKTKNLCILMTSFYFFLCLSILSILLEQFVKQPINN